MADRVVWQTIKNMQLQHAHTGLPTVAYRTNYRFHYDHFGVAAPVGAKVIVWDLAAKAIGGTYGTSSRTEPSRPRLAAAT